MRKYLFLFVPVFAYLIWPYIALFKLYAGLEFAKKEIVNEEIHWPPFRKGIEEDINHFVKKVINKNLEQESIKIGFSSTSLTRKIADEIATPEGVIYLYHHPNKYAEKIRKIFEKVAEPEQLSLPTKEKPIKLEGPNVPSLWERIDYIFFTDFSHFKASFKIENKPFIIIWERHGFDWKVVLLKLPLT